MPSTEEIVAGNEDRAKETSITKPSEGTRGGLLDTNNVVTVDEEVAEDQEMEDSYVFVEADYHSYSDVESSVTEGSSSECGLSERGKEEDVKSKSEADKMEEQNGGVRKGLVKKTAEKKTSTMESNSGKDEGEFVSKFAGMIWSLYLRSINGTSVAGSGRALWQKRPGTRDPQ